MKFSLIIDDSLIVYLLVYVFVFSGRRNTRKAAKVVSSSSKCLYVQVIDGTKKHAFALFGLHFASIIEFFFLLFPLLNSFSFSSQLLQKCLKFVVMCH